MTRSRFGGDASAWVVDAIDASALFGAGQQIVGIPVANTPVAFAAASGGSPVTDFTDPAGNPLASIVVTAGVPYLPFFYGPDSLTELWFQDNSSAWRVLQPSDLGDRMGSAEDRIGALELSGGGGGGGGGTGIPDDRRVYQLVAGSAGWPARPDSLPQIFTWVGPDQPPVGTVAGSLYMSSLDDWKRTDTIVATS